MTKQHNLLEPPELIIAPPKGNTEPRLWVRRLVLWSEPGVVLREVKLRPGLNIVWSPDPGDQVKEDKRQSMGHGSGKTLLCRMIRYCLGEDRFAPEEQQSSIAIAFMKGLVGAEVILDGTVWAILRPIGIGRQHYAIPHGDFDSIISGKVDSTGIEPFLKAVESGILSADVAALIPGEHPFRAWLVALAWLARDQGCHLEGALKWRSIASESVSPVRSLSEEKILEALRVLIGAIRPEECKLREEIAQLKTRFKKKGKEIARHDWEAKKTLFRLIQNLDLRPTDVPSGRLAIDVLRNTAKERLARIAAVDPTTDVSDLDGLRTDSLKAERQANDLQKELAGIEAQLPEIERLVSMLKGELPGYSVSIDKAKNPQCPICEVPIDRVHAEGCKLSSHLPNFEEIHARWEKLKEEIEQESARLQLLKERQVSIKKDLPGIWECSNDLKNRVLLIEKMRDARADAWYKARRLMDEAGVLDEMLAVLEKMQSDNKNLAETTLAKRERKGAFRDEQAKIFQRLSYFFDVIIRQVAGPNAGAEGRITLNGRGLNLSVKLGGERSTSAIDSLKVTIFDLAVLCMSMEGQTKIPAFLIHDSPRESDLGISLYHRLFQLAVDLEKVGSQPLFQYIVTTTTRPPDEILKKPWLRETLGGAPAKARLLKRDL